MQQIHSYSYNSNGITYPTALDISDNLVSAVIAPKQSQYKCLECSGDMAVCRGEIKRPHFRHISDSNIERFCNPESYIHKLAKRLLKDKLDLALRNNTPFILKWRCTDCRKDFSVNITDHIDQVEVEQSLFDGAIRPDLTLFKNGKPIITLEVVNTHTPEEKTLGICYNNKIKVFVICVSPQDNLVDDWKKNEIDGKWVCHEERLLGRPIIFLNDLDGFTIEDQLNEIKANPLSYLFDFISIRNSHPLCEKCVEEKLNKKIYLIEKDIEEKKKKEKLTYYNHNNLRSWDGEELIMLAERKTGKTLGLFMEYKIDENGLEYVSFCNIEKIKPSDGMHWVKGFMSSYEIFGNIETEDKLLEEIDIKTRCRKPTEFIRINGADWCLIVLSELSKQRK